MRRLIAAVLLTLLGATVAAAQPAVTTNNLRLKGAATGGTPVIEAYGRDTDINIGFSPKGAGTVVWTFGAISVSLTPSITTTSYQGISADVTFPTAGAGHAGGFWAAIMGNMFGANLAATGMTEAGVIGGYTVTGTNASTYAKGGIVGLIQDTTTTADGAVVAVLGGDSGTTRARAAFTVDYQNSAVSSYFSYGLDLAGPGSHDSYQAAFYPSGDIRLQNGALIVGVTVAITANVTTCSFAAGTFALTTNATGRATLWICDGTKYQKSV